MEKEISRIEVMTPCRHTLRLIELENNEYDVHCMTIKSAIACKRLCKTFEEAWSHFEELAVQFDCEIT